MKKIVRKVFTGTMGLALAVGLASCGGDATESQAAGSNQAGTSESNGSTKKYDNETTPLTLSTQALDGVFNPFYYTSGYDGEITGITQISMLSTDKDGGVKVGDEEACVVKDYTVVTTDERADKDNKEDYDDYYTTYQFLIKDDLKFSDGSSITIQDVLFNMYVYLDPTYTGSTTMYSTNIKGLKAYRSQSEDDGEQENFEKKFNLEAEERIQNIRYWADDKNGNLFDKANEAQVLADIETMKPLFKKELLSDWNTAEATIDSYKDTYKFTEAWQVFLFNYGRISVKAKADDTWDGNNSECPEALNWNGWDTRGVGKDRDYFVNAIYSDMVENKVEDTRKQNIKSIVTYYGTAANLKSELVAQAKSSYYSTIKAEGGLVIPNISGITTHKARSFNGKDYNKDYDVLQIVVNGVDPKAIWNFGFVVAPMAYYSTEEEVKKANISTNNFGVTFGSKEFMDNLQSKMIPVGGGAYMVSSPTGSNKDVKKVTDFYNGNIVYFERNPYFFKHVNIKYLRYKVISSNKLFDAVASGEVDYADPSAKVETVMDIQNNYANKLGYELVDNLGYGYIGINANYVQSLEVRRAIMHAMDTSLVLTYYTNEMASIIHRSMSSISWAYPEGAKAYYEFVGSMFNDKNYGNISEDTKAYIEDLVESAGYTKNSQGLYHKKNEVTQKDETLTYTFTLAGETEDHPAYNTFQTAARILNQCGFKINVVNDASALSKLSNGTLTVWAAAWSSTIDPDMYQVYHKDSTASSVKNWGYPYLLEHGSDEELEILDELADLIDAGRETTVQSERKAIYAEALDKVMELAVELPTYQRKNLFVYNKEKINPDSMNKDITPYNGPISKIWELSFNN